VKTMSEPELQYRALTLTFWEEGQVVMVPFVITPQVASDLTTMKDAGFLPALGIALEPNVWGSTFKVTHEPTQWEGHDE
jgi:hypothetical protein